MTKSREVSDAVTHSQTAEHDSLAAERMLDHAADYFADRIPKGCGCFFGMVHLGLSGFVYVGLLVHGMNPIPGRTPQHLSVGFYVLFFPFALLTMLLPFPIMHLLGIALNSSIGGWVVYRVLRRRPRNTKP